MPPKLAVIASHPVQYIAPVFRRLSGKTDVDLKVFYGWEGLATGGFDPGFEKTITWDIPLLNGYDHEFVPNVAADPGSHHFRGLVNPDLIARVEAWKPDALLVFGWKYHSHLSALRHFSGRVPVLFRGDSTLLDERSPFSSVPRRLALRWIYRHVDIALYVGSNNKSYFRKHGMREDQLVWAPHAVDNQRFLDPDGHHAQKALQWRRAIGIPDDAVVFLFAGKLERKKDPELLLTAQKVNPSGSIHFLFVGDGPLQARLRSEARGMANVHFLGFQNQSMMPTAYRLGDVFVLPSQGPEETWGLAVNEAMASGLPVLVSTKAGCAPDLVVPGRNGFVFEARNIEDLTRKIRQLTVGKEELRSIGEESSRIIKGWSIEKQAMQLERAVHSVWRSTEPAWA